MADEPRNYISEVLTAALRTTTNAALASAIGVAPITLTRLRRGMVDVQAGTIIRLANYFQWTETEVGSAVWYADKLEGKKRVRRRSPKKDR